MQNASPGSDKQEQRNAKAFRAALPEGAVVLRPPTATRPALWQGPAQGRPAVFKDYRWCGAPMRFLGRFLLKRERDIYARLAGLPGIPQCYGLVGPYCLAVERIPGKDALQFERAQLPPDFFDRLETLVREIHSRGVVHCDMKHRQNIVVTPGYRPYIVDLAMALTRGSRWNLVRDWIFRLFAADDRKALVKIRYYLGVEQVSAAQWRLVSHQSGLERAARATRARLRALVHALIGYRGAGELKKDVAPSRRRPKQ